ncbi:MAG: hypothetical protein Tsb009_01950 [Planctomycetaceae bacterium]
MAKPQPGWKSIDPRINQSEWIAVLVIVIVGLALRVAFSNRLAVEHFDEGIYSSNIWFGIKQGSQYPFRALYAPPLLPALIEWSIILFGPMSWVPMLVNLIAGTATILLLWRIARSMIGPIAGLSAAALCALSDYHIVYSRTALTDPLMGFFTLAAVYCIWRAHSTKKTHWSYAAGLLTGLAWYTKYNGWLPLAIGYSGIIAWQIFTPKKERRLLKHLSLISITTSLISLLFFGMILTGLHDVGGYAAIANNHAQYVVGFSGWMNSFLQQAANHRHFSGWLSCTGIAAAIILPLALNPSISPDSPKTEHVPTQSGPPAAAVSRVEIQAILATAAILLMGFATWIGATSVLTLLAIAGLVRGLASTHRTLPANQSKTKTSLNSETRLAYWLIAAWFCGLLIATPFYRPYPRLSLPWLIATWLGAAAFIQQIFDFHKRHFSKAAPDSHTQSKKYQYASLTLLAGALATMAVGHSQTTQRGIPGWQPRDGMLIVAEKIDNRIDPGSSTNPDPIPGQTSTSPRVIVLFVYGEPALFHQLQVLRANNHYERVIVQPIASLNFSPADSSQNPPPERYLIVGPHAQRSPTFQKQWDSQKHHFTEIGKPIVYPASDLVLLNEFLPRDIAPPAQRPTLTVQIFRWNDE